MQFFADSQGILFELLPYSPCECDLNKRLSATDRLGRITLASTSPACTPMSVFCEKESRCSCPECFPEAHLGSPVEYTYYQFEGKAKSYATVTMLMTLLVVSAVVSAPFIMFRFPMRVASPMEGEWSATHDLIVMCLTSHAPSLCLGVTYINTLWHSCRSSETCLPSSPGF